MKAAFSKAAFQQAWEIVKRDSTFPSEFKQFVSELPRKSTAGAQRA
jgi:hypothetical protein